MSTTFHTPLNGISTTVGVSGRTAGAGTLVLATGGGAQFGSTFPLIVTVARSGVVLCVLEVTGRSSDTLNISGAIEGTSDSTNFVSGDVVEMRPTALAVTEIQAATNALQARPRVSVSAVTTLTSTAYGKTHVCTGSSYALTLPTAASAAGERIYLVMDSGLTGVVTVTAHAGEAIGGGAGTPAATRIMWAGEAAELESDGTNWVKVSGLSVPMSCLMRRADHANPNQAQTIPDSSYTQILLNQTDSDPTGLMADPTTNHRINIIRGSNYQITGTAEFATLGAAAVRVFVSVERSGTGIMFAEQTGVVGGFPTPTQCAAIPCAAGDFLKSFAFQNSGGDQFLLGDTTGSCSFLSVVEIPSW